MFTVLKSFIAAALMSFMLAPSAFAQQPVSITNGSATQTVNGQANVALVWTQLPQLVSGVTAAMTATTSTQVVAGVASNYLYITTCVVTNTSTTGTLVNLQNGSAGTTIYTLVAPSAASSGGGQQTGMVVQFPIPLKVPTSGNGLYAANVTTSSSVILSCNGFASATSY